MSFGPNVCIFDHDHRIDGSGVSRTEFKTKPVTIGDHVWVGANVIILKGVTTGENVAIGAGVVVAENVSANSILIQNRGDTHLPYNKVQG